MAVQWLLKNLNKETKSKAEMIFGPPSVPELRPNVFGEILRQFLSPQPILEKALNFSLMRDRPHFAVHLRVLKAK